MTRGSAAPSLFSIGEVLVQLRGDFPDVTISKIRFLESLGLVEPVRTPSNYRKFTGRDVDRLRYVLAAQRDRFLPLRRIRAELDAIERGEPVVESPRLGGPRPADGADGLPGPESFARDDGRSRLSRDELLEHSGLDEAMLTAMESYGIVSPRQGTTHYDGDMLAVAQAAAGLAVFGVEARHLRGFRTAAEREMGLIEQLVVPLRRQRGTDARGRADVVERELAAACVRLHAALLRAGR
ncbi:MAG: MerR family transcriptional regulator [Actinomycetes bacterium]